MPKSESSNPNDGPSFQGPRYQPNWLVAVGCFLVASWLLVAMLDFTPNQTSLISTQPVDTNLAGSWGAHAAWAAFWTFGVSAWCIPFYLYWLVYLAIRMSKHLTTGRYLAMVFGLISGSGLLAMVEYGKSNYFPNDWGGLVGELVYQSGLKVPLGGFGSAMVLGAIYIGCFLFILFTKDIGAEFERLLARFQAWREERAKLRAEVAEAKTREKDAREKQKAAAAVIAATTGANNTPPPTAAAPVGPAGKKTFVPKSGEDPLARAATPRSTGATTPATSPAAEPDAATIRAAAGKPEPKAPSLRLGNGRGATEPATDTKSLAVATGKVELNIVKPEEPKKAKITLPQSDDANYQFPPLTLLKEQVKPDASNTEEEHRQNAENLLRILSEFGVEVTLGEIHVGPVITRYEVVPAPGVRVEKIAGLDKNIALGMRAQSVRILAPIPGKAAVGVEVPNQKPTPVGMRELLESEDWVGAKAELPIALGKDVSGKPLISDLAKMPHLLIAGATGSGKSVCINSIVASVLYSKSPKDVRLIMVDPKVVELKIFNTLPHMLIPVVTEPKKVPAALKWLLGEMEQRYQIFAKANVRNISGFNSRKRTPKTDTPPPEAAETQASLTGVDPALEEIEIPDRLPYIVAIIDELADLMMVAPAEIETSIARLAQLARAAGIHLIIATQRPSVNVITGVIKANLPSRIAFQVASQVDSRTILDTKGADTLIGRGDMLFSPPGTSRLVRAQGAFVSDDEVSEMVEFLKRNGPPQYAQSVQQHIDRAAREDEDGEDGGDDGDLGDDEDLYEQALDVLKSTRRASTSMLQRRLRIGYNRAARIMEIMEEKGIVGPENGSSPREILVDLDSL
ncbi:DNA translocase FtsK [Opitutus sp. ER46]|uniref:FtsK/SpoIIIE family DNA translocase n=1 Tax=Opitutus sp. ER46 TaxID=2161864 RepID=UPI000D31A043|nr:DNA translocase FtsK [Opitutus sp. ER46]PTX97932.1 cell division protein FtsK [Opitutus sp. ER46]